MRAVASGMLATFLRHDEIDYNGYLGSAMMGQHHEITGSAMIDQDKSKEQVIEELATMRRREAASEGTDAERKRAEAALRQSEARYRALAESTRDIIFVLDRQGTLLYANRAASQCIGIPAGDIVGKRQVDLFPPEMARSQVEKIERVFATGEVIEYDDLFHFGPAEVWLRIHLVPIRDETGQIATVMGVCHNITERKQAELALAEREARLLEAQEVANLGFYVIDLATGRCTTSSVLDRLFGIPADYPRTIEGWADRIHLDDRQAIMDRFTKALERNEPFDREYRIVRYADQQVRWVHGIGRLRFNSDGQPLSMLGTIQDITERKLAEEALRESEERFRLLVEAIPQPIWRSDADGNVIEFNRRWREYTGQTAEEAKGSGWTKALHSDEAAMVVNKVRGGITSGAAIEIVNRLRRASDGSYRWHLARAVPMNDRDGKLIGWFGCATDIDDQKRAEEALTQSEEALQEAHDELEHRVKERTEELAKANEELDIFRRFAEDSDEGFGMSDFDGRIVYANSTLCRLFGEEKPGDVIGKHVSAYYPQEYLQRRKDELIPALLGEGHLHIEQNVLPRNGKPIQTLQSTFLIRDKDGSPFRIAVVISDITERKEAEQALRQSHDELQAIYNGMFDGLLVADIETKKYVRTNVAMTRMLGYSEAELRSLSVEDVHPRKDLPLVLGHFQMFAEGKLHLNNDVPLLRKDGSEFYALVTASKITFSGRSCLVGIFHDISERKRAEEALRQSHDELQTIYDGMFDGLLVADIETRRFVRGNAAMSRMLGYSETELRSLSVEDIHPEADVPFVIEQFQGLAEGKLQISEDVPVLRKDGSVFHALVTTSKVTHDDRRCIAGFFHDVTDRKRAEAALKKEYRNLKHLLHASDHERQTIAYEIHDELAQQLAGAIMQFDAFDHLKETKPKHAADAYHAAVTMLRQGHSETRRLIAGVRPPILDEAGVVEAVDHLLNELRRGKGPKIEFRNNVEFDRLVPVLENAVYRIAQEALTNACKHSKSERISVSLLQRGDRLRVEIRDWGVGFDPKAVPKNHFGLEGIRQRARLLGGKCSIRSNAGKGARIMVELPVVLRDEEE